MQHVGGEMEQRANDAASISVDRKIPLWGILCLMGAFVGQGVLLWAGSREQAIESRYMAAKISDLTVEVKSLATQIGDKSTKDLSQDSEIKDAMRRIEALERGRK